MFKPKSKGFFGNKRGSSSHASSGRKFSGSRGGSRSGGGRRNNEEIELSKYIKKAVQKSEEKEYVSKHQFSDFDVDSRLKENIVSKKFTTPTPIQDQTIPAILEGKDLLGIANTGTGKTAAFLIPLIDKVVKSKKQEKVLIIAPTRELALQINDEFKSFSRLLGLYSVICIGGTSLTNQIRFLKRDVHFVIGTPGRLKDLVNRKVLNLSKFSSIVLDEVDRMLDMGFVNDIRHIISLLPVKRQSLFFSATVSREADVLIKEFLNSPVRVSVKSGDTAENVEQDIIKVKDRSKKIESLHDLLINEEFKKVLIFGRTKRGVEDLSQALYERGFKVGSIHGDKSQSRREKVLELFKTNRIKFLVATDVAARGLDIADITHVINYDQPATYDDYIHRIGRTGRANKVGKALTFV